MRRADVYGSGEWMKATNNGRIAIEGEPDTVVGTIKEMETTEFEDGKKQRVIIWEEDLPNLGLNVTNWDTIADFTGRDDDEDWSGVQVECFVVREHRSKTNHAIRVRQPNQIKTKAGLGPGEVLGPGGAKKLRERLAREGLDINDLANHLAIAEPDPVAWPKSKANEMKRWIEDPDYRDLSKSLDDDDIPF